MQLPHQLISLCSQFVVRRRLSSNKFKACLVQLEIQKPFKILCHIKSCGTCIKH